MKNITNKDIIWSYIAQFLSMASGILVLPLILSKLTVEEVGVNYLMLTITSLVALFDFGFAPQFSRNIAYIYGGAQELKKEGTNKYDENFDINYRLLATLIHTAKNVYRVLGFIVFIFMLSFGTFYIAKITNNFSTINNFPIIWVTFIISVFFNIYYIYLPSLMLGSGKIKETKKIMICSKLVYLIVAIIMIYLNFGLFSLVFANLISPFVNRILSYKVYFTKELREQLSMHKITNHEKKEMFLIIWHNSKKLGLVFIGGYGITKFAMFISGLYLPIKDVAAYGLMMQLTGIISTIAGTYFVISEPRFSMLTVKDKPEQLMKEFSFSMIIFYILFFTGGLFLIFIAPYLLSYIRSNTYLPSPTIISLYLVVMLLETNHSYFATIIVIGNSVPFMWVSLITGLFIAFLSYLTLTLTDLGVFGLVMVQGVVQVGYNNWKWPNLIFKEYNLNLFRFLNYGYHQFINNLRRIVL